MNGPLLVEVSATRKAAVVDDELSAFYPSASWHTRSVAAHGATQDARAVRAVVETFRFPSGTMPRALLGAKYRPGPGTQLTVEVGSARDPWNAPKTCHSRLWLHSFRVGLPEEYVAAVLDGLADPALPPGVVSVDRAGHDDANSSPQAFFDAARLLAQVLAALMVGGDVEAIARDAASGWA